ncbi:MAG: hypothetical protein JNL98_21630 [Bryobacterales bacterium]|nr:hypothetical protein [Bryobacterales bacterium]
MSAFLSVGLKWLARFSALALAGLFLFFAFGEFRNRSHPPQGLEWVSLALLAIACFAPVFAWKWELPAAIVSLSSLILFVLMEQFSNLPVATLVAVPSILSTMDWTVHHEIG